VIRPGRDFSVLLTAHFLFFVNFSQLILLPKYLLFLGMSPSQTGIVMGTFSVSVLVALPAVGLLSEMISRRILFMSGAFLMAVPTIVYPEITGMTPVLFILRMLQGIGFACAFGVAGAIVSEAHENSDKAFFLGMLTVAGLLTQAVGPVLGEYLIRAFGYGALFLSAFLFGIFSLCAAVFIRSGKSRSASEKKEISISYPMITATGVLGVVFGSMVIFLPPYLMTCGVNDSSPFFLGFVLGGLLVWTAFYRIFRARRGRGLWIFMSALLVIPLLYLGASDSLILFVISLLSGIGYGYLYPTLNAGMIDMNSQSKGMANALFVWSFNVGMLIASVGFGFLCDRAGYQQAFWLTAAVGFMILVVSGLVFKENELLSNN